MVCEKNTHAMTLLLLVNRTHMQGHWWIHVWSLKRTHISMTLVDPYVVCEKNTHAMTLVVVSEKNTHAMTLLLLVKRTRMQ